MWIVLGWGRLPEQAAQVEEMLLRPLTLPKYDVALLSDEIRRVHVGFSPHPPIRRPERRLA